MQTAGVNDLTDTGSLLVLSVTSREDMEQLGTPRVISEPVHLQYFYTRLKVEEKSRNTHYRSQQQTIWYSSEAITRRTLYLKAIHVDTLAGSSQYRVALYSSVSMFFNAQRQH